MKTWQFFLAILSTILLYSLSFASDAVNVAGTWNVIASNGRRSAKQTIVIQQDGSKISGTFKGPRQSGTIDGTIADSAITFHVTAKEPLDYTGTISGDTMKGTLSGGGKSGEWTAERYK
jgi:hypothetical protein